MVQRKFDAIHEFHGAFSTYLRDSLDTRRATIIPIIMNDDALGDPMSFNAHPEHASWAEVAQPNCYPDSEIRNMRIQLECIATQLTGASIPDAVFDLFLIACAFPEDLDAIDEKSGLSLKEVLELQKETTDRQCYPLWANVKMINGSTLATNIPGLTTNQVVESVAFQIEILRDQMKYGRIKGLIKKSLPMGLRAIHVPMKLNGGRKKITINFTPSGAKFINPYTFLGLGIATRADVGASAIDMTQDQTHWKNDLTADVDLLHFMWHVSYNERNPEFHMAKV